MKRSLLFTFSFIFSIGTLLSQTYFSDDLEGYDAGTYFVQSAGSPWSTWDDMPGSDQDVMITDAQAFSGDNSIVFTSNDPATPGPANILLDMGNQLAGIYGLSWMMYIPSGHGAYFSFRHDTFPGEPGLQVTFRADNSIEFTLENTAVTPATFPHDQWFEVSFVLNLNIGLGGMYIDQGEPLTWTVSSVGQDPSDELSAINFVAYAGGDPVHFYMDDIVFEDLGTVNVKEAVLQQAVLYPNPVTDILTIELPAASSTTLLSVVDITGRTVIEGRAFTQQGPFARTQVDMNALPQGLYLVRIQDGANESVHRVVRK